MAFQSFLASVITCRILEDSSRVEFSLFTAFIPDPSLLLRCVEILTRKWKEAISRKWLPGKANQEMEGSHFTISRKWLPSISWFAFEDAPVMPP